MQKTPARPAGYGEQYYRIDKANSYMVGDSAGDVEAGRRYGIKTIRIGTRDATADYSVRRLEDIEYCNLIFCVFFVNPF